MLQLLGQKIGMSHVFGENGVATPVTLIKLYDNCVIDLKVNEDKEFDTLTMAFEKTENAKKLNKPQIGAFNKKSVAMHKKIKESRVKKGLEYKTNDTITVDSFIQEGDLISVSGISMGKGFAGVMKRYGFGGLEATHGVSVSHRSHGSTGQRQDPGKVFKGKKMAGHMGTAKISVKNLQVVIVDKEKSLIALKGAVPGNAGGDVIVKIAKI
jgi:large subunit ribosomal protein L3